MHTLHFNLLRSSQFLASLTKKRKRKKVLILRRKKNDDCNIFRRVSASCSSTAIGCCPLGVCTWTSTAHIRVLLLPLFIFASLVILGQIQLRGKYRDGAPAYCLAPSRSEKCQQCTRRRENNATARSFRRQPSLTPVLRGRFFGPFMPCPIASAEAMLRIDVTYCSHDSFIGSRAAPRPSFALSTKARFISFASLKSDDNNYISNNNNKENKPLLAVRLYIRHLFCA